MLPARPHSSLFATLCGIYQVSLLLCTPKKHRYPLRWYQPTQSLHHSATVQALHALYSSRSAKASSAPEIAIAAEAGSSPRRTTERLGLVKKQPYKLLAAQVHRPQASLHTATGTVLTQNIATAQHSRRCCASPPVLQTSALEVGQAQPSRQPVKRDSQ